MGWLRLVGSFKLEVSFAEYSLFYMALLQKRPANLRSLLIVATAYLHAWMSAASCAYTYTHSLKILFLYICRKYLYATHRCPIYKYECLRHGTCTCTYTHTLKKYLYICRNIYICDSKMSYLQVWMSAALHVFVRTNIHVYVYIYVSIQQIWICDSKMFCLQV